MEQSSKTLENSPFRFEGISFNKLTKVLLSIPENATLRIGNALLPENVYILKINGEWCKCLAGDTLHKSKIEEWSWDKSVLELERLILEQNKNSYPKDVSLKDYQEYRDFYYGWTLDFDFHYKYPLSNAIIQNDERSDCSNKIRLLSKPLRFVCESDVRTVMVN